MPVPDLSIVLVNHNAKDMTMDCIRSINEKTQKISCEIILVDNNSSDGSQAAIREQYPDVRLIENLDNKGFAAANNQGMQAAKGKYLILLNNDTVLKNPALDKMVDFLDKNPRVGVVTCKLFDADGKTIQRNCRSFPTPWGTMFGRASLFTKIFPNNPISKRNLLANWDSNSVKEVDWVSGAALMVRNEVIKQVGLLDEKFYMYWEDTDWCKRIRNAGWEIFFIPDAEIIHFAGAGGTKLKGKLWHNHRMTYHMHRSAYYYFRKHYLKSRLNPMTWITFLGFIILTSLKITLNSIKMLIK
jgi:GT2 family glycosyltransferase